MAKGAIVLAGSGEAAEEAVLLSKQEPSFFSRLVLIEGGPWGSPFWPDYSSALAGSLREIGRRSFSLTGHSAGDWLDANSLLGADWEAVKAQSSQTLDINVIVYEIVR